MKKTRAVLTSIKPEWCELIASGKKTIEVRKTMPKLGTPFKCYIYCTKAKYIFNAYDKFIGLENKILGKVIGEFVCNLITGLKADNEIQAYYNRLQNDTCITDEEIIKYAAGKKIYYWYISDLKIYDKPKELSEFVAVGDCDCLNCAKCKWLEKGNGFNVEDDCLLSYENSFEKPLKPLFRPPQSWCYVEEI